MADQTINLTYQTPVQNIVISAQSVPPQITSAFAYLSAVGGKGDKGDTGATGASIELQVAGGYIQ